MDVSNFTYLPLEKGEEEQINEKISAYADSMAPPKPHTEEEQLIFKAEDGDGKLVGGCVVNVHAWGRAVLAQLWVDGPWRRHGLGSALIHAAENAAREKGCYYLCLGTADFMARPLYEKHGFRVFTVNRDIPMGHLSWSLSKRLDKGAPDYVPMDNSAAERFSVRSGSSEDAKLIGKGLEDFCVEAVPDKHEYIPLSKKLVDEDGRLIAAVIAGVDEDDTADLDGIWVEEPYRGQGVGAYLLREIERELEENGAYAILAGCCDWVSGFFLKSGYTVRGELADYPKGHTAYELEKRL